MKGRIQRVRCTGKRTAQNRCPWATFIVRVDGVFVCYERYEDAGEQHAPVSDMRGIQVPFSDPIDFLSGRLGRKVLSNGPDLIPVLKCCTCKQWKPKTEYYKQRSRELGLTGRCKECYKNYYRSVRSRTILRSS